MSNLCLAYVTTVAILIVPNGDQLHAWQSVFPPQVQDADTTLVGQVDVSVIDAVLAGLQKQNADSSESVVEDKLRQTKTILDGKTVWLTANWPRVPTKITISVADADGTCVSRLAKLWNLKASKVFANRNCTVSLESIRAGQESNGASKDRWQKILADSPQGPIRFAMQPPSHFYRTLDEVTNELPGYLGGGPVTLLTEGALSANVSLDPATHSLEGFIQSKNAEAAEKFKDHLSRLLPAAIEDLPDQGDESVLQILQQVAKGTSFSVQQDRVRIQFQPKSAEAGSKLARQAMDLLIGPASRQSQQEQLRNAAIAILNYESAYRCFPPPAESRGPDRATGLSWRVHILPFMGEVELWKKFKMDQPWDSPANKKLLAEMPDVYSQFSSKLRRPADAPKGMTTVQAPASGKTILGAPHRVTFGNISDGSSNTVLLVVVKDSLAVPWTAPKDYQFDPDDPAAGLLFVNGKASVVAGDGSTQAAARDNQWLHLFEMNDGNVVQLKE